MEEVRTAMKIRYDDATMSRRRSCRNARSSRARRRRVESVAARTTRPASTLPLFEGPLDLLLYLIRRDQIDIHDIPIAPITRQYMEYLELMQQLNLDVAGEFMVMAATLIHIKSKMLVPIEPTEAQGEEEAVDPREELVQRLLEFQRYKEAAGVLHQKARDPRRDLDAARHGAAEVRRRRRGDARGRPLRPDRARSRSCSTGARRCSRTRSRPRGKTVEQRIDELLAMIREGESLEFLELFAVANTKGDMIVTFLALLELIRLKRVKVYQRGMFGSIRVFRPVGPTEGAPAPAA